jgi:hypothetical protein
MSREYLQLVTEDYREDLGLIDFLQGLPGRVSDYVRENPRRFLPGLKTYTDLAIGGGSILALELIDKAWSPPTTYLEALVKGGSYMMIGFGFAVLGAKTLKDYVDEVNDFSC